MSKGNYTALLKSGGFQSFLWAQFLEAFNDNVFKFIVCMIAIDKAAGSGSQFAAIAGGVFVLPFLLFSGYSAWLPMFSPSAKC